MTIQEMFTKSITRDVKGVIKVGQGEEANVKQELEEYVVTRELQKHIARFFEAYKKSITGTTDHMGVWISGFFGSGKSHFLKILSYLLENRVVDGKRAIDYFVEDHKIENGMVLADMKLAADTSADVILFNIDSKSEMSGKQDKEAILSVFLKVFNEMQGFYGANPHIADLERNLYYDGRYDEFKQKFEEVNGEPWTEARNEFDYSQDDVVDVLVDMGIMTEEAARNLCEKAFTPYPKSIEDFARMIKKYVEKKGKNHHIVFLVDEIGQYIGADPNLMLNLQTVTEDLGTACQGKAWIIVTSQQDIDSVIKVKGNDFSKIMGRFDTRLSLSSANVDEVIRKRILEKTPVAKQTLEILYEEKATTLKNLISFNDGIEKKLYSSKENFAEVYPFVPYQFNLLGDVLTQIRTHGASGKSLADGARSMLALFKESAERIMDKQPGALVPFHFFYDALEQFIEHNHRDVITRAMDNSYINPDHEKENFSVNVLKVLFMIKYVNTIKANKENLASLMVSDVDDDRLALIKKVEEALDVLERQGLIQKSNDVYVFLTNEEQEIQRQIEQQQIDLAEINAKIAELIFDGTFTEKKYRYPAFSGRYAFAFNQVVDDRPYKGSTGHDLTLRIITPNSDESTDEGTMRLTSGQSNVVLVVLPEDRAFINEISGSLKIEKFLRLDATNTVSKYEEIKAVKKVEMREHSSNARTFLTESLRNADIYVAGDRLQTSAKDISSKINDALAKLVDTVYHKLSYITAAKGEADVKALIHGSGSQIKLDLGKEDNQNQLALNDVRDYIAQNTMKHMKTSMKTLMDRFIKAPYGFIEDDVEWLVAKLYKDGDIALFVNSEAVTTFSKSEDEIVRYITRKEFVEKLMIDKKEKAPDIALKVTRDIMKRLFNITSSADNEDDLMKSFLGYAKGMKQDLEKLDIRYQTQPKYPGKQVISNGKKLLNNLLMLDYAGAFYKKILEDQDDYRDFAEDYEPLKTFFEGEQKTIFDKSLKYMAIFDDSKTFVTDEEIFSIVRDIKDILKMDRPYGQIFKLPGLNEKFGNKYTESLENVAKPIYAAIAEARKRVIDELTGKKCESNLKPIVASQFDELQRKAEECNNIAHLQNIKVEADTLKIRLLNKIATEEAKLNPIIDPIDDKPIKEPVKKQKTISIKTINTSTTWQLETPEDVDKYLRDLRNKLISKLEENTVVHIEF